MVVLISILKSIVINPNTIQIGGNFFQSRAELVERVFSVKKKKKKKSIFIRYDIHKFYLKSGEMNDLFPLFFS